MSLSGFGSGTLSLPSRPSIAPDTVSIFAGLYRPSDFRLRYLKMTYDFDHEFEKTDQLKSGP